MAGGAAHGQVVMHLKRTLTSKEADVVNSQTRASDGRRARPPRRMAAYRRKCRQLRPVVGALSSAATSDVGAKADMVHLGGQVSV